LPDPNEAATRAHHRSRAEAIDAFFRRLAQETYEPSAQARADAARRLLADAEEAVGETLTEARKAIDEHARAFDERIVLKEQDSAIMADQLLNAIASRMSESWKRVIDQLGVQPHSAALPLDTEALLLALNALEKVAAGD
jgi:predicted outer membrane protein